MNAVVSPSDAQSAQFTNGKTVDFVGKRKMIKESRIDGDQVSVDLYFRNGQYLNFDVPDTLVSRFAAHGAEQKLGDQTAGCTDVNDMYEAVRTLIDQLNAGEWSKTREGGGGFAGQSILLRALVEITGKPVEKVREFLKSKSQKEKLALRQSKQVKPVVDRLESESTAKESNIDTDALLSEI